jgi:hypothetical protein
MKSNIGHCQSHNALLAAARHRIEREFPALRAHQPRALHLALNEAEAVARLSGFPQLVFPTLALEKAESVSAWHRRQQAIRQSGPVLSFAE